MPSKPITLADRSEDFSVKLTKDGESYTYAPALVTRSSQRRIRRIQWELEQLDKNRDLPKADGGDSIDLGALTEEQLESLDEYEGKALRLVCDLLSASLKASDDAPPAGDILFDGWSEDEIGEDEIYGLMADMNKARGGQEDPTPA